MNRSKDDVPFKVFVFMSSIDNGRMVRPDGNKTATRVTMQERSSKEEANVMVGLAEEDVHGNGQNVEGIAIEAVLDKKSQDGFEEVN